MNTCIKCGCDDAYPSLPPCPAPTDCPNPPECAEVYPAECVILSLANITCGTDIVVFQGDSIVGAIENVVAYFCQRLVTLTDYINTQLSIINGRLTIIEADIVDIKGDIIDIKEDIVNIQEDIVDIQGDIVDIKDDIIAIQGDIIDIQGDIVDIQGDIVDIQNEITVIGNALPVGSVIPWAGQLSLPLPNGWLPCDGSLVSTTTYAALFAVINDEYGTGAPIGQFYLPNLIDAIPYGSNSANVGTAVGDNTQTGTVTVGITVANLPEHSHTLGAGAVVGGGNHNHQIQVTNTGGVSPSDAQKIAGGMNVNTGANDVINTGAIDFMDGDHTHTFSGTVENTGVFGTTQATGTITSGDNRQRGISMRYMIKY
jgi:microcystin-dependent protein